MHCNIEETTQLYECVTILDTYFVNIMQVNVAKIMYDPKTNEHRGFGFVDFETLEGASNAIQNMHHVMLEGSIIKVQSV